MKVGYIIVRENLDDPLISSQVLDVIEEVNKFNKNVEIELIWFYRLDYLVRHGLKNIRKIKLGLEDKGVKVYCIPFLGMSFPVPWWLLPLTSLQWMIGILYLNLFKGIQRFHCRSYHAGLIGLLSKKLLNAEYIFDPRSPFPEENVAAERWKLSSCNFIVWKKIEKRIVNSSMKTIMVSPFLKEEYWGDWGPDKFAVIPNSYPKSFDQENDEEFSSETSKYDFVYVGSFGHWNRVDPYIQLLKKVNEGNRSENKFYRMLFLVRSESASKILRIAEREGVSPDFFDVRSVPQSQVKVLLKECRAGVYLMEGKDPRLGVKTVEYLRSGLPVIVSKNIKGAADLVSKRDLGIAWDHSDEGVQHICDYCDWLNGNFKKVHDFNVNFSKSHFSSKAVAEQLLSNYLQFGQRDW